MRFSASATLRLLARRIMALTSEIRDLQHQITAAVTTHTPTLLTRRGIGPDNAAALLIAAGDNPTGCAARHPLPPCAASACWKRPRAEPAVAGSIAAATGKPTPRSTASPCPGCAGTPAPAAISTAASPRARPVAKPSAASNDTSPARSTRSSRPHPPNHNRQQLDIHRGIRPSSGAVQGYPIRPGRPSSAGMRRRFHRENLSDPAIR
jgi:hypothetical protein